MNRLQNLSFSWANVGIFLFLVSLALPLTADILTLNNGDELFGTVKNMDPSGVTFERNGSVASYTGSQILKLEFETLKMPAGEDTVEHIKDPIVRETLKAVPTAEQFPQAMRLDILDEEIYELKDAGTWEYTARQVFVPFKEAARDDANHSFGFFPDLEIGEVVYGRSITPPERGVMGLVGGKPGSVRYVSDHTIADEPDFGTVPLYQRRHTVKFAIPEVMIGSIVDRVYRVKRSKGDRLKPFLAEKLFRGHEPARLMRLVVRAPRSLDLVYQILGPAEAVKVEKIEKDTQVEWRFEARDTEGIADEPLMPELENIAPRVTIGIRNTWEAVGREYEALLAPLRTQALAAPAIEAEVARLCSGTTDVGEKVKRVFNFLARDIGDVDVFPDWYSWQPHSPGEILAVKQANHVDRAFLYHCLLLKAGIQNQIVPVRWRMLGSVASEVPSLMQMSDLVVEIPASVASIPIGLPVLRDLGPEVIPAFLQGASGLRLADGRAVLVPFRDAAGEGSFLRHEGEMTADGMLRMKTTLETRGTAAGDWRGMRDYSKKEQQQSIEGMLNDIIPGTRLVSFQLSDLDDTSRTPQLSWEWEVASFALRSGDDLLVIPLPVNKKKYSAADVGASVRRFALNWDILRRDEQTIHLKLPEGYTVYALPEGGYAATRGILYHSRFGFSVNRVLFTDVLERHVVDLESSEYPEYKKLIESRSQTANQWIVIRRSK